MLARLNLWPNETGTVNFIAQGRTLAEAGQVVHLATLLGQSVALTAGIGMPLVPRSKIAVQTGRDDLELLLIAKGGLVVVVGCEDTKLITELAQSERFLVQALDTDPAKVAKAHPGKPRRLSARQRVRLAKLLLRGARKHDYAAESKL